MLVEESRYSVSTELVIPKFSEFHSLKRDQLLTDETMESDWHIPNSFVHGLRISDILDVFFDEEKCNHSLYFDFRTRCALADFPMG